MSVISIKRLLGEGAQSANHPLRVAQILVRGMGMHAIEGDPEAFKTFRGSMDRSAESLGQSVTEAAALVVVNTVLRVLEEYNRGTESYLHSGGNDLRAMLKMLTAAITEFSNAGGENVQRLKHIESRLASAGQSNDILTVKKQLANCLDEIKKEVDRQKAATATLVNRLQEDLQQARTESVDPATGLRPRSKAVDWIIETCASKRPAFAACLAIDRLQSVNLTFGSEVGDQILRYFASHVGRNLPAGGRALPLDRRLASGGCVACREPAAGARRIREVNGAKAGIYFSDGDPQRVDSHHVTLDGDSVCPVGGIVDRTDRCLRVARRACLIRPLGPTMRLRWVAK